jgi:hypothetical protein
MPALIQRLRQLPPQTIGLLAAVITVSIWSAFIVIARASASGHLLPLDIAWARIMGARDIHEFVNDGGQMPEMQAQTMPDEQLQQQVQAGNMVPMQQVGAA